MKLGDALYYLFTVPRCVCCRRALPPCVRVLCDECRLSYDNMKMRTCSVCFQPIDRCLCAPRRLKSHGVKTLVKVTRYVPHLTDLPSNALVYSLKEAHDLAVFDFLADEIYASVQSLDLDPSETVLTFIPRRPKSVREFGYDHAEKLAHRVGRKLGIPSVRYLKSKARHQQKEMSGEERLANAVFVPVRRADLTGKTVLLLDDIVTTGASMSAAAMHLRSLGAKRVVGVCFSIAYTDDKVSEKEER